MSSSGSLGIGFPFAAESSYSHTVGIVLQVWERLRKYQDQIGGITVVLQCHSFGLSTSSPSSFRMKYKTGKNTIKALGFFGETQTDFPQQEKRSVGFSTPSESAVQAGGKCASLRCCRLHRNSIGEFFPSSESPGVCVEAAGCWRLRTDSWCASLLMWPS